MLFPGVFKVLPRHLRNCADVPCVCGFLFPGEIDATSKTLCSAHHVSIGRNAYPCQPGHKLRGRKQDLRPKGSSRSRERQEGWRTEGQPELEGKQEKPIQRARCRGDGRSSPRQIARIRHRPVTKLPCRRTARYVENSTVASADDPDITSNRPKEAVKDIALCRLVENSSTEACPHGD